MHYHHTISRIEDLICEFSVDSRHTFITTPLEQLPRLLLLLPFSLKEFIAMLWNELFQEDLPEAILNFYYQVNKRF